MYVCVQIPPLQARARAKNEGRYLDPSTTQTKPKHTLFIAEFSIVISGDFDWCGALETPHSYFVARGQRPCTERQLAKANLIAHT
jgi:hypothetical protein